MKNITLSINDDVLKAGREYAKKHNMSFSSLVRYLLEQAVLRSSSHWLTESFNLMDKAKANSRGQKWKREDLYRI